MKNVFRTHTEKKSIAIDQNAKQRGDQPKSLVIAKYFH